jgi:hypothetical protein
VSTNIEPPDISGDYRPKLLGALKQVSSVHTRTMLRPAIRHALTGIESLCSTTMAMTPAGVVGHFGPREDVAQQLLPMVVASPAGFVPIALAEWPKQTTLSKGISVDEFAVYLWAEVSRAVESQDAKRVADVMLARLSLGMVDRFTHFVETLRAEGQVPLLVAICAREEGPHRLRASGITCVMRLPERIAVHLVDDDAQHTRH